LDIGTSVVLKNTSDVNGEPAFSKFEPTICTFSLPLVEPLRGSTLVTVGRPAVYVYWSEAFVLLVTPSTVTVMSTVVPAVPGGMPVIAIDVGLLTVKQGPEPHADRWVVPTETCVALYREPDIKLVPVMVTVFPPLGIPAFGDTFVTVGALAYAYSSAAAVTLVPPVVCTVMSIVPAP
jgi:hypothetical protein